MALIGVAGGFMSPATPTQPGGAMKRYDVVIGGNPTTLLLSDQDARARGLLVDAPKPAEPVEVPTKAKTPANKGRRTVTNKRATKVDE